MLNNPPVQISDEYNYALDRMEHSRDHLFITGKAGTGKSTLLGIFRDTTKKRCVFLAPTGVAALNIRGQTIHSFFKFPPKLIDHRELTKRRNNYLYRKVECIVIDEISMVRVDMIDAMDIFLQKNRGNSLPFGGVQMIFFGDLFQLPPVIASAFERQHLQTLYDSPYFFSAHAFSRINQGLEMIELHKVYRQSDVYFIRLLDNIRTRNFDMDDLNDLNQRTIGTDPIPEDFITLATRNNIVNRINAQKLQELSDPEYSYNCKIKGKFESRVSPAPPELRLRRGAQVMFVRNDPERNFVNGTIGKVTTLDPTGIQVSIADKEESKTIELSKEIWEIVRYQYNDKKPDQIETEVIGTFEQYPITLAWAVTIHKSQGKTFKNVLIDLGSGSFDFGQTYVALSRCQTLDGIYLKRDIRPKDVLVDERIVDFYNAWR